MEDSLTYASSYLGAVLCDSFAEAVVYADVEVLVKGNIKNIFKIQPKQPYKLN